MPEPGSKKYDKRRSRLRHEAEERGIPDRHANEDAGRTLQEDPRWRTHGPRTERGLGPKGERRARGD